MLVSPTAEHKGTCKIALARNREFDLTEGEYKKRLNKLKREAGLL